MDDLGGKGCSDEHHLVVAGPRVEVPPRSAGEEKTLPGSVKVFALSAKNFKKIDQNQTECKPDWT